MVTVVDGLGEGSSWAEGVIGETVDAALWISQFGYPLWLRVVTAWVSSVALLRVQEDKI